MWRKGLSHLTRQSIIQFCILSIFGGFKHFFEIQKMEPRPHVLFYCFSSNLEAHARGQQKHVNVDTEHEQESVSVKTEHECDILPERVG